MGGIYPPSPRLRWAPRLDLRKAVHRLGLALVVSVPLAAPFPLGSVDWPWILLWAFLLAVGAPLLDYSSLTRVQMRALIWLLAACSVVGSYLVVQSFGLFGLLPANPLFAEAGRLMGVAVPGYPSVVPAQSQLVAGGIALAVLAFSTAFVVGAHPARARLFLVAIGVMIVANGCIGVLSLYLDPTRVLWRTLETPLKQPSGTFTNRNNAVTLFATGAAIFFCLLLHRALASLPRERLSLRDSWLALLLANPSKVGRWFVLFAICMALTLATSSRGGTAACLAGLGAAYLLATQRRFRGWARLLPLGIGGLGALALWALVRFSPAGQRLEQNNVLEDGRLPMFKAMGRAIADNPWFGTGLGTFEYVIPAHRPADISPLWVWDYAHSGPLKLLMELGIPMGLFALAIPTAVVLVCLRGSLRRRRDADLPLIGASVGIVGLVHSLVDFSLQIPGYALVYAAVLGVGFAQAFSSRSSPEARPLSS